MATPLGSDIPAVVQSAIQQNLLKDEFEKALQGEQAYQLVATGEPIRARKGNTLTLTRSSALIPTSVPVDQVTKNSNLDNGLTADQFTTEQFTLTMKEYIKTANLNIMDDEVVIAKEQFVIAREQGVQAGASLELISRGVILNSYMGGNSRVVNNNGVPTTTTCDVDDVRGYENILVLGAITAVSGSNTLSVKETANGGGGQTQVLVVTGVSRDTTNKSTAINAGGVSGILTFQTANNAPVVGDSLVAVNAPKIVRAGGHLATNLISAQDVFTSRMALDMRVALRNNAIPPFIGGTGMDALDAAVRGKYVCILSPTSSSQLLSDPAVEKAFQTRYDSELHQAGFLGVFQGVVYWETNFAPLSVAGDGGTSSPLLSNIERPIMFGRECLIRGDFEGLEDFVAQKEASGVFDVRKIGSIIHIIRDALDRAGQNVAFTWDTVIDYACPSDLGTTNAIFPSATGAMFKRAVVGEHVGF